MYVRIRADNGFPECGTCLHYESNTCARCDDAEEYELDPDFADRLETQPELLAA